jgi:hypothetical protein
MDGSAFDRLTRTVIAPRTRRGVHRLLGGLAVGGPLALLGGAAGEARKKNKKKKPCPPCKKRKKGKCKANLPEGTPCISPAGQGGMCQGGSCVAAAIPPPAATCSDGIRNGTESDVDCGGSCARCPNNKRCTGPHDCATAYCVNGACGYCPAPDTACGPGGSTTCTCQPLWVGGAWYCVDQARRGSCGMDGSCPGSELCVQMSVDVFPACHALCGAP